MSEEKAQYNSQPKPNPEIIPNDHRDIFCEDCVDYGICKEPCWKPKQKVETKADDNYFTE